jgi:hypothetical protein
VSGVTAPDRAAHPGGGWALLASDDFDMDLPTLFITPGMEVPAHWVGKANVVGWDFVASSAPGLCRLCRRPDAEHVWRVSTGGREIDCCGVPW